MEVIQDIIQTGVPTIDLIGFCWKEIETLRAHRVSC